MHDGHLFLIGSIIPLAGAIVSGFFYFNDPYRFYDMTSCSIYLPLNPQNISIESYNTTAICNNNMTYFIEYPIDNTVDIWYDPDNPEEYVENYDVNIRTISLSMLIVLCCFTGLVWRAACRSDFYLPPFCRKLASLLIRRRL